VRIEGLETLDYLDNLSQRERHTEQGDAITFESEVNIKRIFNNNVYYYYTLIYQRSLKLFLSHVKYRTSPSVIVELYFLAAGANPLYMFIYVAG
jgi:hypothetical protein